jgi:hypothetical protein
MLKRIIVILVAGLCLAGSLLAQDTAKLFVPKRVKNKMLALYPQTQEVPVTWTKDGLYYRGSLTIMEKPAFIVFDSTGKVIRTEKRIHQTYLPKKITGQLNTEFPGNVIKEIFEYTDAAGVKTYKTTIQATITRMYNEDGTIAKEK